MVLPMASDSSGSVSSVRHADRPRQRDVVVGEDIVGQRLERLVELAGSIEQAGLEEPLDDVVFSLLNPGALRAERADVLSIVADVGCADDVKRGVLGFLRRNLQRHSPRCG